MTALEALQEALNSGGNLLVRPMAWSGTGRGITWSASDARSGMPWREGWITIPRKLRDEKRRRTSLPEPEHLFDEWEVITFAQLRSEWQNPNRPEPRQFRPRSPTFAEKFPLGTQ
jgi:hypothetical protein